MSKRSSHLVNYSYFWLNLHVLASSFYVCIEVTALVREPKGLKYQLLHEIEQPEGQAFASAVLKQESFGRPLYLCPTLWHPSVLPVTTLSLCAGGGRHRSPPTLPSAATASNNCQFPSRSGIKGRFQLIGLSLTNILRLLFPPKSKWKMSSFN